MSGPSSGSVPSGPSSSSVPSSPPKPSSSPPKPSSSVPPSSSGSSSVYQIAAEQIKKAVTGLGTNDELLVNNITKHTNEELQIVAEIYEEQYKESLIKAVKGDTSGSYRDILVALVKPKIIFQANQINKALKGLGTDEKGLIDILAHASNEEIHLIRGYYAANHKRSMDAHITSDTSGLFQKALLGLVEGRRRGEGYSAAPDPLPNKGKKLEGDPQRDPASAAEHFYKKVASRDEVPEFLLHFLIKNSFAHIYATDAAYTSRYGHPMLEVIIKETSGDLRDLLKAILTKPEAYWAYRIHEAIKGIGTDNKAIVRAFALNNREQLGKIGNEYVNKYGKTLKKVVDSDTSGWYRAVLMNLLNYSGHY